VISITAIPSAKTIPIFRIFIPQAPELVDCNKKRLKSTIARDVNLKIKTKKVKILLQNTKYTMHLFFRRNVQRG